MREIVLRDPRDGWWLVQVPTGLRERMRGLRGRDRMEPCRAFLIPRTRSIHTFGMRFPITVALLDARLRVVAVLTVGPARIVMPRPGVRHVLECGLGADLRPHDVLRLGYAGQSGKDHADQGIDGQGDQCHHHGEDLDAPSDPGRKGHRHSPGGVGRDDPQELQQRPHTTSSAIALPV
ncbi:MAG: DUF192 domain-containing protein [Actinomycetota bacterium]